MRLPYNAGLIVFVLGSFRRRRFVAKFAVPNFATSVSNVATGPQGRLRRAKLPRSRVAQRTLAI